MKKEKHEFFSMSISGDFKKKLRQIARRREQTMSAVVKSLVLSEFSKITKPIAD